MEGTRVMEQDVGEPRPDLTGAEDDVEGVAFVVHAEKMRLAGAQEKALFCELPCACAKR
jgi:hypothetical protein